MLPKTFDRIVLHQKQMQNGSSQSSEARNYGSLVPVNSNASCCVENTFGVHQKTLKDLRPFLRI